MISKTEKDTFAEKTSGKTTINIGATNVLAIHTIGSFGGSKSFLSK